MITFDEALSDELLALSKPPVWVKGEEASA
jgi:hypothetical protein